MNQSNSKNTTLDTILERHLHEIRAGHDSKIKAEVQQLVGDCTPEKKPDNIGSSKDDMHWGVLMGYNQAIRQFEDNLKEKGLIK